MTRLERVAPDNSINQGIRHGDWAAITLHHQYNHSPFKPILLKAQSRIGYASRMERLYLNISPDDPVSLYLIRSTKFAIELSHSLNLGTSVISCACSLIGRAVEMAIISSQKSLRSKSENQMIKDEIHAENNEESRLKVAKSEPASRSLVHKSASILHRLPHRYELGSSCLWMATKLQERSLSQTEFLISVVHLARKSHPSQKIDPKELDKWAMVLVGIEYKVLKSCLASADTTEFYFDRQPHGYIDKCSRMLTSENMLSADQLDDFEHLCWSWLNDFMRCILWSRLSEWELCAIASIVSGWILLEKRELLFHVSDASQQEESSIPNHLWNADHSESWCNCLRVDYAKFKLCCEYIFDLYECLPLEQKGSLQAYYQSFKILNERDSQNQTLRSSNADRSTETQNEIEEGELIDSM